MHLSANWFHWALLSAVFAALTAILAKLGVRDVDPDFATLMRTVFILLLLAAFVVMRGQWINPFTLSPRSWLFLGLSALATGASWVCYFRALQVGEAFRVAPVDKLSVVLAAFFAVLFLGERPGLREWMGIALIAGGVLLLAIE